VEYGSGKRSTIDILFHELADAAKNAGGVPSIIAA
jgi:hypothetical protein